MTRSTQLVLASVAVVVMSCGPKIPDRPPQLMWRGCYRVVVPGQPDTTRLALDTLPGTTPAGPVYWLRTLDSTAPGGHQGWWRVASLRGAEISWERRDGDVHVLLSREQKGIIGYMWTADARHAPDAPTVTAIKSMCPPGALGK